MYRTKAAEALVDKLITQSAMNADKAKNVSLDLCNCGHDRKAFDRGLYTGWADALTFAAEIVREALPEVETDSFLLPPADAERSMMAGDFRDFPA